MNDAYNNFKAFVAEQREYYEEHLNESNTSWEADVWGDRDEKGWLTSSQVFRGFNFDSIKALKGYPQTKIEKPYVDFIKAMCVAKYRRQKCGPVSTKATSLDLKRCYSKMVELTLQTHPCHLTTQILEEVDKKNEELGYKNLSDMAFSLSAIQALINANQFVISPLMFTHKRKAANKANTARKAKKIKENKDKVFVDDKNRETDKNITLQAFMHIAWLSNNTETDMEMLGMRMSDLLIIAGFRGTECALLPYDCLIERELIGEKIAKPVEENGKPKLVYGLKYWAMKNSPAKIHWLEPKAVPAAKRAIKDIKRITKPYREHLKYLRETDCKSILPKDIVGDDVCIEDIMDTIMTASDGGRGRAGMRDKLTKALRNDSVAVTREVKGKKRQVTRYYDRQDLEAAIRKKVGRDDLLSVTITQNKKQHIINLDDLLMIAPVAALKTNHLLQYHQAITNITQLDLSHFLGCKSKQVSIFDKYELKEEDGSTIQLPTHAPRHNINTYLDLCGVSEHVQAMMMGRADIKQNLNYQHTAILDAHRIVENIEDSAKAAEATEPSTNTVNAETVVAPQSSPVEQKLSPIDMTLNSGVMEFSPNLSVEHNLHREWHSADNMDLVSDFMSEALDADEFLGELQDTFNELKTNGDLQSAKELIEENPFLHPVVNGACTRDAAKTGCPHRLKCITGKGCSSLVMTGRAGEFENLLSLRNNLASTLSKATNKYGNDLSYAEHIGFIRFDLSQVETALEKAKEAKSKRIPISVFADGEQVCALNSRPKTLIDLFAEQQFLVENESESKSGNTETIQ